MGIHTNPSRSRVISNCPNSKIFCWHSSGTSSKISLLSVQCYMCLQRLVGLYPQLTGCTECYRQTSLQVGLCQNVPILKFMSAGISSKISLLSVQRYRRPQQSEFLYKSICIVADRSHTWPELVHQFVQTRHLWPKICQVFAQIHCSIFLRRRQKPGSKELNTRDLARKKHVLVTFCVRLANADERQSIR